MDIKIKNSGAEAAKFLSSLLADKIRKNQNLSIGFATGRTMDAVYFHLSELSREQAIDFSKINAFLLDEYIGLPRGHKNLFQEYLKLHLLEQFNFSPDRIHFPDVFSNDFDHAAKKFEEEVSDAGGLDLVILGVGTNGHIAFNEPGSAIDSRTRVVGLTSSTLKSNQLAFAPSSPPVTALTMGVGTILEAKECWLIATGESKSEIIQKLVNGDINSQVPATALKSHKNFTLILDCESGKLI